MKLRQARAGTMKRTSIRGLGRKLSREEIGKLTERENTFMADPNSSNDRPTKMSSPLSSEQFLIDTLNPAKAQTGLVISPGHAQLASHLVQAGAFENMQAWYLDLHDAAVASAELDEDLVDVLCGADLPDAEYDLIAMPVLKRGEAELTRDLMQQAHQRLREGGLLAVSVDNPRDNWLHQQMQALFEKVTSERGKSGCIYTARKRGALKKIRNFDCEFSFRDSGRTLRAITRPGVFSHRRLDPGAKQLMLSAEVGESDNVLELGSGAGCVSFSVGHQTTGTVFGVDSNARAAECLERGAQLNELSNIAGVWNADGQLDLPSIDLVLANPPYFGEGEIWQHFVDTGIAALRKGGAILVVNKHPSWYEAYFDELQLEDIVIFEAAKYFVACGRKP